MVSRVETGEAYVNGFPLFWMTPRVEHRIGDQTWTDTQELRG
jgi:hypothetical protein